MKNMSEIASNSFGLEYLKQVKLVDQISTSEGNIKIPLTSSDKISCEFCGSTQYVCSQSDTGNHVWICGKFCEGSKPKKLERSVRAGIKWLDFCKYCEIGDEFYNVRFEEIDQKAPKLDFLRKYAEKPCKPVFMKGEPGRGKTYAALGLCELFIRSNPSCMFISSRDLASKWLQSFKGNDSFIEKIKTVNLLVIDDFGTADPTPAFMAFLMEIIDKRNQWKDRGTVITTNLDDDKFGTYCGDALFDRINTGQKMIFTGESRRQVMVL